MEKENLKPSMFDRLCEGFSEFSFFGPSRYLIYKDTNPINNLNVTHPENTQATEDDQKFETQTTNN